MALGMANRPLKSTVACFGLVRSGNCSRCRRRRFIDAITTVRLSPSTADRHNRGAVMQQGQVASRRKPVSQAPRSAKTASDRVPSSAEAPRSHRRAGLALESAKLSQSRHGAAAWPATPADRPQQQAQGPARAGSARLLRWPAGL